MPIKLQCGPDADGKERGREHDAQGSKHEHGSGPSPQVAQVDPQAPGEQQQGEAAAKQNLWPIGRKDPLARMLAKPGGQDRASAPMMPADSASEPNRSATGRGRRSVRSLATPITAAKNRSKEPRSKVDMGRRLLPRDWRDGPVGSGGQGGPPQILP